MLRPPQTHSFPALTPTLALALVLPNSQAQGELGSDEEEEDGEEGDDEEEDDNAQSDGGKAELECESDGSGAGEDEAGGAQAEPRKADGPKRSGKVCMYVCTRSMVPHFTSPGTHVAAVGPASYVLVKAVLPALPRA